MIKQKLSLFVKKSNLDDKGVLQMDFKTLSKTLSFEPNITPADVIKNQKSKIYPKDLDLIKDLKRCI